MTEVEYEILLFCPSEDEWINQFEAGYGPESGSLDDNECEAKKMFDEICKKVRDELYSKLKLVKNINKVVYDDEDGCEVIDTLSTEIIKEFEQLIDCVERKCVICSAHSLTNYNPNNRKVCEEIKNNEGFKKYVSPCEGIRMRKECICGECNISWFCDNCTEDDIYELEEYYSYCDDKFGLTVEKIKRRELEKCDNNGDELEIDDCWNS